MISNKKNNGPNSSKFWKWLKTNHTQIEIIVIILFSALTLYYTFNPPAIKPHLSIYNDFSSEGLIIFIHNGGLAPCYDLTLEYNPRKIEEVQGIINYEKSHFKYGNYTNGSWKYPAQIKVTLNSNLTSRCINDICNIKFGYLNPNELTAFYIR